MRETTRQRLAFNQYVSLGAGRSLEMLRTAIAREAAAMGFTRPPSLRTLARWSAALHWQDRLADLEREARKRDAEAHFQALKEMNERQGREGLLLQQKAVQKLQALTEADLSTADAIRALTEGARLERLARGEVTERSSIKGDDIDLTKLSLVELRALAEVGLSRPRGDRPADEQA